MQKPARLQAAAALLLWRPCRHPRSARRYLGARRRSRQQRAHEPEAVFFLVIYLDLCCSLYGWRDPVIQSPVVACQLPGPHLSMCAYSVIITAPVRAATLICLVRSPCLSYANIAVFVLIC